jgi:hypothetical protein
MQSSGLRETFIRCRLCLTLIEIWKAESEYWLGKYAAWKAETASPTLRLYHNIILNKVKRTTCDIQGDHGGVNKFFWSVAPYIILNGGIHRRQTCNHFQVPAKTQEIKFISKTWQHTTSCRSYSPPTPPPRLWRQSLSFVESRKWCHGGTNGLTIIKVSITSKSCIKCH